MPTKHRRMTPQQLKSALKGEDAVLLTIGSTGELYAMNDEENRRVVAKGGALPTILSPAITVADQPFYLGVCKAAMDLVGRPVGKVREPMENLTGAERKELRLIIKKIGALVRG